MRNKYKQKEKNNEKLKEEVIIEKKINFEKEINFKRAKSPKNAGNIMTKLDLLNKFNKLFYEKENKRNNSVRNDLNRRKKININLNNMGLNMNKKKIKKEIYIKEENSNNNIKLKIIRHSSFSKFDNEDSIQNNIEDSPKIEKKEIKNIYIKKYSKENKEEQKEKVNFSINDKKGKDESNKNINVVNDMANKKKNYLYENNKENYKENNIYHMTNVEDFDKPNNNLDKRKNNFLINSPICLLKKKKYKNDDNILLKLEKKDNSNNSNSKETFQFLVNQAYKNKDLSNSFNKYYESRARSRQQSKIKDDNNSQEKATEKKYKLKNKILNLLKSPKSKNITNINGFNDIKKELNNENIRSRNIKTLNFEDNIKTNISSDSVYVNKKIINQNNFHYYIKKNKNINNTINTNLNINNNIKEEKKTIFIKNNILKNNLKIVNNKNKIPDGNINNKNEQNISSNININKSITQNIYNIYNIDLELIYSLDEKIKLILNKINNFKDCKNECYNYIQYYFNSHINEKIINFFTNKDTISYYIKMEILCFFLCYDISSSSFYNQTVILLKTILNIIHINYYILLYYIISLIKTKYNNNNALLKIINMLEQEPAIIQIKNKKTNESNILKIISNNLKNINNYYKMVIDNIYGKYNNIKEESIKFPNCVKNIEYIKNNLINYKFINIISSFFFDAYKSLKIYDFLELQKFFNLFLNQNKTINSNGNVEFLSINNKKIYLLPKIKKCYKYSLVLDLDETLISFPQKFKNYNINNSTNTLNTRVIFRPGLNAFLKNMKQFYELILFSSGTSDYVDPIINSIEKNEKYFEFVLYRQHISFDERGESFKNLNLLNRDIKNILIIDNIENNFKFHKANGICIKPFYGDLEKDRNILNLLGQILVKIRINAEESGDIRISLNNEKNNIIYSKVAINHTYKENNP